MIDPGSPSSFAIFAAFASNDLFMRRWIALCEDPAVAELADATLDSEDHWYGAREALQAAIRAGIEDLQRLAEQTVPDVFTPATMRHLHELCYDAHLALRRQAREQTKVRVTLVVDPDDGEAVDEEHLAVVSELTGELIDPAGWRRLRERLAACKRPARVWTTDRAIQVEWDAPDDTNEEEDPVTETENAPPSNQMSAEFITAIQTAMDALHEKIASDPSWATAAVRDLMEFFLPHLVTGLRAGNISLAAFDEGVASFEADFQSLFAKLRAELEKAA